MVITAKVTGDRVTAKLGEVGVVWVRAGERVEEGGSKCSGPRTAKQRKSVSRRGEEAVRGRERGDTRNCPRRVI